MPLLVELPDASEKMRSKFKWDIVAQTTFQKPASLGNFNSNGIISNDRFTSVLDGDPVIRTYDDFVIDAGHIVTPTQRCKGMYLFIEGDLIVNGILSMTARGAKAAGKVVGIDYFNGLIHFNDTDIFSQYGIPKVNKVGGLGAARVSAWTPSEAVKPNQHKYTAGVDGLTDEDSSGGGGSGAAYSSHGGTIYSGAGAPGTSFSGGPGGGSAICIYSGGDGYGASPDGGAGGAARLIKPGDVFNLRGAGGGAGNNGGAAITSTGGTASPGQSGTGGLMILVVKGNIIFGPAGKIESKGSNGGRGDNVGGAGSGGGVIKVFTQKDLDDLSKFDVTGGLGGSGSGYAGGKGGNGSCKIHKVRLM